MLGGKRNSPVTMRSPIPSWFHWVSEREETERTSVLLLGPLQYSGWKRIENLWKPTCENLRFLSQVTFSVMQTNRKKKHWNTRVQFRFHCSGGVRFPSRALSWVLSVWTGATMIDGHGTERVQKRNVGVMRSRVWVTNCDHPTLNHWRTMVGSKPPLMNPPRENANGLNWLLKIGKETPRPSPLAPCGVPLRWCDRLRVTRNTPSTETDGWWCGDEVSGGSMCGNKPHNTPNTWCLLGVT